MSDSGEMVQRPERYTKGLLRAEAKRVFGRVWADSMRNYEHEGGGREYEAFVVLHNFGDGHGTTRLHADADTEEDARRRLIEVLRLLPSRPTHPERPHHPARTR